jgi:phage tail sheath protein FI
MARRNVGVHGTTLPTKKSLSIQPSDFTIGGLIGRFPSQYAEAIELRGDDKLDTVFGEGLEQYFGHDAVIGFFENAGGASLWVKSHIGNDGSAIDAVSADEDIDDAGANPTIKINAAYREIVRYGTFGNNIAHKVTNGDRYSTTAIATAIAAATEISINAVGDIKVGDILKVALTGGGTSTVHHKITEIDESGQIVKFTGPLSGGVETLVIGDVVSVIGVRVQTYIRSKRGIVSEIETELGKTFCSMEPEVVDYYIENVHKENQYITINDLNSASTLEQRYPINDSNPVFLTGGLNGTAPSTTNHWDFNFDSFDNKPVRVMTNSDTSDKAHFDNMEAYSINRITTDFPVVIPNGSVNMSATALENVYRSYQRSQQRLMVNCFTWYEKPDQYNSSPIAPKRQIPPVGHNMGCWIRAITEFGAHQGPAIFQINARGVTGVVGHQDFDDAVRTRLIEAGGNISQVIDGAVRIRNWITPSTLVEFLFGHTLIQMNLIRESVKGSMTVKQNEPNVFKRIERGRDGIVAFMARLWRQGNNGKVEEGEFFGQQQDPETLEATQMSDHFEVISDPSVNDRDHLLQGKRDYNIRFTPVPETLDIYVNVGIILPSV